MEILLSTLSECACLRYPGKLETNIRFWRAKASACAKGAYEKDRNIPVVVVILPDDYKADKKGKNEISG